MDLARDVGLILDPWQAFCLEGMLGFRAGGIWSAFESGLIVPRQNGKGSILEAREIAGLFLFEERLILHSAHEFKTAAEGFRRVLELVEGSDDLRRRVRKVSTAHGDEGIELLPKYGGGRLRFVARSSGSGRGFTGDVVILDEAYALTPKMLSALMPTLSARPNPQIIYTSSAGTDLSLVLAKLRKRGIVAAPRVFLAEWSATAPEKELEREEWMAWISNREFWADANPGLGIRISEEFIESELAAMEPEDFARERLGIWEEDTRSGVIPAADWSAVQSMDAKPRAPLRFALDVLPDRSWSAIVAAGGGVIELIAHGRGTGWVVPWVKSRKRSAAVREGTIAIDGGGPAASIADDLEAKRVKIDRMPNRDVVDACARMYDDIVDGRVVFRASAAMTAAVEGLAQRMVGDRFVWSRAQSESDISPFMAATLAHVPTERSKTPNVW